MFTLDNIADFTERTKTIEIDGETYSIRLLDGVDRLRLGELEKPEEIYRFGLANGLLDGKTEKPIGEKYAYKLLRSDLKAAIDVFKAIVDWAKEADAAIVDAVESERKNSDDSADSKSIAADIANGTDSIPEPRI